ncbi:MAG: hypothetical protein ACOYT4_03160 [Nanoarchaeota archaeon]
MENQKICKNIGCIPGLDKEVKGFFANNIYRGMSENYYLMPFEVKGFRTDPLSTKLYIIPNLKEGELYFRDLVWETDLIEMGIKKFGLILCIAPEFYYNDRFSSLS